MFADTKIGTVPAGSARQDSSKSRPDDGSYFTRCIVRVKAVELQAWED